MHGEHPIPEYAHSSEKEPESVEAKKNVIEFPHQEPPAEHVVEHIRKEAGSHDSAVLLSEADLVKAREELEKLKEQSQKILRDINGNFKSYIGNKKDKESINNLLPKNLPEISQRIHKLQSDIAFTEASGGPYKPMSKDDFDKLTPHQRSMSILKEAGFASIEAAEASNPSADSALARKIISAKKTAPHSGLDEYQPIVKKDNVTTPDIWTPQSKPEESEEESRKVA